MSYAPGDLVQVKVGRNGFPVKLVQKVGDAWQVQLCNESVPSAISFKESDMTLVELTPVPADCKFPSLASNSKASRKNRHRTNRRKGRRRFTRRRA